MFYVLHDGTIACDTAQEALSLLRATGGRRLKAKSQPAAYGNGVATPKRRKKRRKSNDFQNPTSKSSHKR